MNTVARPPRTTATGFAVAFGAHTRSNFTGRVMPTEQFAVDIIECFERVTFGVGTHDVVWLSHIVQGPMIIAYIFFVRVGFLKITQNWQCDEQRQDTSVL